MNRRPYIDWLRGVAVLLMIEWHSIDAWTVPDGRGGRLFQVIIFSAGWAAPLFLFLAGVSLPLAGGARMARGATRAAAAWALQKRGWWVFFLAHLFRFQSFVLNPSAEWNSLLRPDILNVLGLGIVATAACWGWARSRRALAYWLLIPAAAIAVVITPWSVKWWWPTLLNPRIEAYIRPVGDNGVFSLFPLVAFVFAGAYLGALIAAGADARAAFHWRTAGVGAAMLLAGLAGGALVERAWAPGWTAPAWFFAFQTGAMTLGLAASWALLGAHVARVWRPIVVLGRTSLLVYWVHVELAYGVFSYPLHHALTLPWSIAAYAALTMLMFGLASWWIRRPKGAPIVPAHMAAGPATSLYVPGP